MANVSSWMVENYRFTGFFDEKESVDPETLFRGTGLTPDSINRKPKEEVTECLTNEKSHKISLRVGKHRFDFTWQSPIKVDSITQNFPFQQSVVESVGSFQKRVTGLLEHAPRLTRMAYGAMCHESAASKESSYERLAQLVPDLKIDPINSTDLIYRINRPRSAEIAGERVLINRLATWSGVVIQLAEMRDGKEIRLKPQYSARVEIDINTHGDLDLIGFGRDRLVAISNEFFKYAAEILVSGDKP